jgi:hypothetical protein
MNSAQKKTQTHVALHVAGLAMSLASITAAKTKCLDDSRMSIALALATELLESQ